MDECYLTIPFSEKVLDFRMNDLQFWIFDLKVTRKLLNYEIRIHSELYLGRTEFDSPSDPMKCTLVLGLIVGRDPEILVTAFDFFPVLVRNKNPDSCGTGIKTSSAVRIDEKFHNLCNG